MLMVILRVMEMMILFEGYGNDDNGTGCVFRKVPPPKVLSVEDGKIPTKKVKVRVKTSHLAVG